MTDPKPDHSMNSLAGRARSYLEQGLYYLFSGFSLLRNRTETTRHQLKEVFYSTSDQVLEKAEETRKSVKMRMAIMEIEHHLNRLYPQIGKLTCDLAEASTENWPEDSALKAKVDLAEEYRQRLNELKEELKEHQRRSRGEEGDDA